MNKNQVLYLLKNEIEKQVIEALHKGIKDYSLCVAFIAHSKLDLNREQVQEFLRQIDTMFEDINSKRLSVEDIIKTVKEELDVEIS